MTLGEKRSARTVAQATERRDGTVHVLPVHQDVDVPARPNGRAGVREHPEHRAFEG